MKPRDKKNRAPAPAVNCAHDKIVATDSLKANPRNPNKHGPEQLALYAKILLHQGWRKAIVVSNQSGWIVTGEGAWLTAQREGWETVPVDLQDFKTPSDEFAHLLADNRLPQMAEIDEGQMAAILAEDLGGEYDRELAGILVDEVEPELKPLEIKAPPKMAWVLIGIPLVRFGEINAEIEKVAAVPEIIVETTVNDDERQLEPGREA